MKKNKGQKKAKSRRIFLYGVIVILTYLCIAMGFFLIRGKQNDTPQNAAKEIVRVCAGGGKFECFVKKLSQLAKKNELSYIQETIGEMQRIDREASDCHLIAHYVASIELKKEPSKWKEVLLEQDPDVCLGGYFHGILEEYFRQEGTQNIDKVFIQNLCLLFKEDERKVNGCVHVMGHIIMVQEKGSVDNSLIICDELPIDMFPFRCYNGVFMEDTTKVMLRDHGIVAKVNVMTESDIARMEEYCRQLIRKDAVLACWEEIGRLYMQVYKNDMDRALVRCNKLRTEEFRYRCGSFVIVQGITINNTLDSMILGKICDSFESLSSSWKGCIIRVSSLILNININYVPTVIGMCKNLPKTYQEVCFRNIAYNIYDAKSSSKNIFCAKLPHAFRKECG